MMGLGSARGNERGGKKKREGGEVGCGMKRVVCATKGGRRRGGGGRRRNLCGSKVCACRGAFVRCKRQSSLQRGRKKRGRGGGGWGRRRDVGGVVFVSSKRGSGGGAGGGWCAPRGKKKRKRKKGKAGVGGGGIGEKREGRRCEEGWRTVDRGTKARERHGLSCLRMNGADRREGRAGRAREEGAAGWRGGLGGGRGSLICARVTSGVRSKRERKKNKDQPALRA